MATPSTSGDVSVPPGAIHSPSPGGSHHGTAPHAGPPPAETFVEAALKLSGKSEEEARKTGAIDRADDEVEELFDLRYQTVNSPIHAAVWNREVDLSLFDAQPCPTPAGCQQVMDASLAVVKQLKRQGGLLNAAGKISDAAFEQLGAAGYWGMLVDRKFGGQEAPFRVFSRFLTRMATVDPTVAGLGSVHGCIGAVDPLQAFGTPEQKQRFLPDLASGRRLSGFGLTEPGAGSDLTALRTTAVRDGNDYVVNGEKLFITNATAGRTVGLVCQIDGGPAVLIVDLPPAENDEFQLRTYGLHALKHSFNNGLVFRNFRVPAANRLEVARGDGLTIAYHGLNRGRVALCATAAGTMRLMLANMRPWASFRRTYGQAIDTRELVQRRLGLLAGFIAGADALVDWCSWLLDEGFRGEMECIIAKIFGSEVQKEAAIELFMKTHGGRSFLHGHLLGDNVHEFLAPCIYEGEGEMLGMAFLKSLIKQHGKQYYEPVGRALSAAGIRQPNLANPAHLWALREAAIPYTKWRLGQTFVGFSRPTLPKLPKPLDDHAEFAIDELQRSRFLVDGLMQKYQLGLADRQCAMADASARIQDFTVILVTALWAARQKDPVWAAAGDVLCRHLTLRVTGRRPDHQHFKALTALGQQVAANGLPGLSDIDTDPILMPYEA